MTNASLLPKTAKLDKLVEGNLYAISKNKTFVLGEDKNFLEYARQNLWSTRRERGMPWRMDVFQFIQEVYSPWLGNGLVQSDLKKADQALYIEFHKRLTMRRRAGETVPKWIENELPSKNTRPRLEFNSLSEAEKEKHLIHREIERQRIAALRERRRTETSSAKPVAPAA